MAGLHFLQCPGEGFHSVSLSNGWLGRGVQQFIVYRFSGWYVQAEGEFLDGREFLDRTADIEFRQVTGFTHNGVVQHDGGT